MKHVFSNTDALCREFSRLGGFAEADIYNAGRTMRMLYGDVYFYRTRIARADSEKNILWITHKDYSITTQRHKRQLSNAMSHWNTLTDYSGEFTLSSNQEWLTKAMTQLLNELSSVKKPKIDKIRKLREYRDSADSLQVTCLGIDAQFLMSSEDTHKINNFVASLNEHDRIVLERRTSKYARLRAEEKERIQKSTNYIEKAINALYELKMGSKSYNINNLYKCLAKMYKKSIGVEVSENIFAKWFTLIGLPVPYYTLLSDPTHRLSLYYSCDNINAIAWLSKDKKFVRTSKNITMPVKEAQKAIRMIRVVKHLKEGNGTHYVGDVGGYTGRYSGYI